jgi:predicted RNase H-like nuclease (RuvC/YqgF family)
MAVENKIGPLETITKTFVIRDKVFELLDGNVISKEVQEGKSLERIKDAESIDSLKNIFNYVDSVETSLGPVDGKEIADIIQKIEDKEVYIENLTKSHGLRDKVFELLDGDVMSQEAEDQEEINKTKESLVQKDENINIVDEVKEEYESLKSQYQESYEEYRNFLASRPSGLKRALSFFKDKKYMNEMEEKVNSLKSLYQEKEAEYEELKEKVVPFEN